jgi:formate dehydrogenase major subunit
MAAIPRILTDTIRFTLNGTEIEAHPGETILQAARRAGTLIPHLCAVEPYRNDGNCRACMVEIEGERALQPSCWRKPAAGMKVRTDTERARHSRKMVFELLLADMPETGPAAYREDTQFLRWLQHVGVEHSRFPSRHPPAADLSNAAIAVNLDACIQCTACVRACREAQVNDVIGYAHRGAHAKIVFDLDDPMGASSCVTCGECVQACPTGALAPAHNAAKQIADRKVDSACPYCGVGCLLSYHIKDERILYVDGRAGPSNGKRLCVKGRYGFDYVHHARRLTKPLIRRPGIPKTAELLNEADRDRYFREASWAEALDFAAAGLKRIRDQDGPGALAGFGSAKGSNEEAYLFQKLVRAGFGTNNVDHCTRLCHASSVAALLEGIGSGAVSNQVADVADAEVVIVIGARPTVNHPVAATFMKNAAKAGKTLIYMDPYRSDLARHARYFLQFNADTDVPLLNALMYTIIDEGLHNEAYIRQHTEGFEALRDNVMQYPPEKVAPITGIDAQTIREVARVYATSKGSMIFWGMGVSQHVHGTDNARCLIALALLTGQIGRPGTGLHPLRGQNNVQGASDVGLIPMMYPNYQRVAEQKNKEWFETFWQARLDGKPGLTVVEIIDAACRGDIKGMYIMGENPAMSDPDLNHAREGLARLDHLVVQEIFFTETAGFADVILPASAFPEKTGTFTNTDRRVQLGRQALKPPGEARQDWWIIQEIANRIGLQWRHEGPESIWNEIRQAIPSVAGITWDRLEREHSVTYPCVKESDPGAPVLFDREFPTPSKRGKFVAASYTHADELPDREYPFVFTTGRQLEHWHTGAMSRRASVLDAIEPEPVASIHPQDLAALGCKPGDHLAIRSRRGHVRALARADHGVRKGTVFMPFCYVEAAANLLTNAKLDPFGKIPEFKYCAVQVAKAEAAHAVRG